MTKVNYAAMSDRELKHYIFIHRNDQEAFEAYMERRHSRLQRTAIEFDDPAWEEKVVSAIQAQLGSDN
jgi:hypothetical protein